MRKHVLVKEETWGEEVDLVDHHGFSFERSNGRDRWINYFESKRKSNIIKFSIGLDEFRMDDMNELYRVVNL